MELAFKSNLIFLSSPFNCNWPCSETSVHLCLFRKEWDAFKSAGNGILSLRQELLVVQNCKRQLVFCSYIVLSFHHLFKKIDLCFYKWGLRSLGKHFHNIRNKCQKQKCQTNLCVHLFNDLPSHFCLKKVFGNILNRGQRVRQLKTMRKVFTLVWGPPLKVQSEEGCCNICFHLFLD